MLLDQLALLDAKLSEVLAAAAAAHSRRRGIMGGRALPPEGDQPMGFVPPDFEVPELLEADRFRLRPLTVHDVVKDYDAVMTSRDHLWSQFGQAWGWPPADLTLEQDLIDLGWHQKEFQRRSSFAYAVMPPDESRLLGCVYVDPPQKAGYDAEVWLWVRASELAGGLDQVLYGTVRRWIEERWPFTRVAYPGREPSWDRYKTLPDR